VKFNKDGKFVLLDDRPKPRQQQKYESPRWALRG